MARRRYRGRYRAFRKQPGYRKWVRAGFSIGGKVIGGLIIAAPAIAKGRQHLPSGNLEAFAAETGLAYTGYDFRNQSFDFGKAVAGVGTVVAGIAVMKLFSIAARRF